MFESINKAYGMELSVVGEKVLHGLPIYMTAGRKFYEVQFEGIAFLVVYISNIDRFGSVALEKQYLLYQKKVDMPVAFTFSGLTATQRIAMIKKQIPFIVEPDQLYLPFVGVMMRKRLMAMPAQSEKMMPVTQSLFLYLVYSGKNGCPKKDAADALGLTRTSISRASEQLVSFGLIREEHVGKEIHMHLIHTGMEAFDIAQRYMINPIQDRAFVEYVPELADCVLSGESALGEKTMLNKPAIPVYAMDKRLYAEKEYHLVDPKWESSENVCLVELWKYDPKVFAFSNCIDPMSLAMSMKEHEDERIEGAVEEYMEQYPW